MVEDSVNSEVQGIITSVGSGKGDHDARKAELCADAALLGAPDEVIRYVLKIGFKTLISAEHTRKRQESNRRLRAMSKGNLVDVRQLAIKQLEYPIVAPGYEARDVVFANHELVGLALADGVRRERGVQATNARLRHIYLQTAPWPGTLIHELLDDGLLTIEDLFPTELEDAA